MNLVGGKNMVLTFIQVCPSDQPRDCIIPTCLGYDESIDLGWGKHGAHNHPSSTRLDYMGNINIRESTMKCYLRTKPQKVSPYKNVKKYKIN